MNTTTTNLALMKEVLQKLRNQQKMESKFEKRLRQVKQNTDWNSKGIIAPYTTLLDHTHFAVPEEGAILSGYKNEYIRLKRTMRSVWKSIPMTGALSRLKNHFVEIQKDYPDFSMPKMKIAALGRAYEDYLMQNLPVYLRIKNFYAINGSDTSVIGTVSDVPSGTVVPFSWANGGIGNRFLQKGMQIQFYDTSATTLRSLAAHYTSPRSASSQYSQVDAIVSRDPATNISNSGAVTFDVLPTTALAAGDTAHVRQGYGAMPLGALYWIDDVGTLLLEDGTTVSRSAHSHILSPVVQNNGGSATDLSPEMFLDFQTLMMNKTQEGIPVAQDIWMNPALAYEYAAFGLNSNSSFNVQRNAELGSVNGVDVGVNVNGNTLQGKPLMVDADVPPDTMLFIDWMGWEVIVKTADTIYEYHENQRAFQFSNAYGEPIDAKMVTLFSEYNNICNRIQTQGIIRNISYNPSRVGFNS